LLKFNYTLNKFIISLVVSYVTLFNDPFLRLIERPKIAFILLFFVISFLFVNFFIRNKSYEFNLRTLVSKWGILFFAFLSIFIALEFYQSIKIAPNLADTTNYHLPRVFHWYHNESFKIFYTSNYRENLFYKLPDLFYLPSVIYGKYYFISFLNFSFNCISMFTAFNLALLILTKIKFKQNRVELRTFHFIFLFLLILNPIFVSNFSQSNDENFVLMIFLITCFLFIHDYGNFGNSFLYFVFISIICLNSKPTLFLLILPIFITLLYEIYRNCRTKFLFVYKNQLSIALLPVFYQLVELIRNFPSFYYSIITLRPVVGLDSLNPVSLFWNCVRVMLSLSQSPFESINRKLIQVDHFLLSSNISIFKPRTFIDIPFSLSSSLHSDFVGSPLIIILLGLSILLTTLRKDFFLLWLLLFPFYIFSILSFSIAWQPWINRFYSPFFLLLIPFIFISLLNFSTKFIKFISILLLFFSIPWVLWNPTRTIFATDIPLRFGTFLNLNQEYLKELVNDSELSINEQILRTSQRDKVDYGLPLTVLKDHSYKDIVLNIGGDDNELIFWVNVCSTCKIRHYDGGDIIRKTLIISTTPIFRYNSNFYQRNNSFYIYKIQI